MGKRFKIIDASSGCFLIDTTNKFSSIPLHFNYSELSEHDKKKLQKWLDFLNKKGGKK